MFIYEFGVTNFNCISASSLVCGLLASPKADRLASGETGTLTKDCSLDPGMCMRECKASPTPPHLFLPSSASLQDLREELEVIVRRGIVPLEALIREIAQIDAYKDDCIPLSSTVLAPVVSLAVV